MSCQNKNLEYRLALNELAYSISHRVRRPICAMLGLLELIQLDLSQKEEVDLLMQKFKLSLDELDQFSRELGLLIHREQERVNNHVS